MPKPLSTCCRKPVVRWTSSGKPSCSQCGMRQPSAASKTVPIPVPEKSRPTGHDLMSDRGLPKEKPEDTRDFVRHLAVPGKYSACGVRWHRTDSVPRVNCLTCLKTKEYLAAKASKITPPSDGYQ